MTTRHLPLAIIAGGVLVLLAALVMVLSPLLWTDHILNSNLRQAVPAGCSVQSTGNAASVLFVAHCPAWVQF